MISHIQKTNRLFICRCKLPDMSAKDSFSCACNDNSYKITESRSVENWQTPAFWCSGTLSLLEYDGSTKYVWNPFSLQELESIINNGNKFQEYLQCVSTGGSCTAPSAPIFVQQQVIWFDSVQAVCFYSIHTKKIFFYF